MSSFIEHFSKFAGPSFARQTQLADYIGERSWDLDLTRGTVRFGSDLEHPVQLYGTESEITGSWMWAWHNTQSNFPPALLEDCVKVREYGQEHDLPELTDGHYELEEFNGFVLAMFASGICGDRYFYRGPSENSNIYFSILDIPAFVDAPLAFHEIAQGIGQLISGFDLDHLIFARHLLAHQQFEFERDSDTELSAKRGSDSICLSFDELRRITNIEASNG